MASSRCVRAARRAWSRARVRVAEGLVQLGDGLVDRAPRDAAGAQGGDLVGDRQQGGQHLLGGRTAEPGRDQGPLPGGELPGPVALDGGAPAGEQFLSSCTITRLPQGQDGRGSQQSVRRVLGAFGQGGDQGGGHRVLRPVDVELAHQVDDVGAPQAGAAVPLAGQRAVAAGLGPVARQHRPARGGVVDLGGDLRDPQLLGQPQAAGQLGVVVGDRAVLHEALHAVQPGDDLGELGQARQGEDLGRRGEPVGVVVGRPVRR